MSLATGMPAGWLLLLAILGIAVGAFLSAGEEAGRSVTRAGAQEAAEAGRRGGRAAAAISAAPAHPVRAAAYVRLVAEMTGAVAITLVMAGLLHSWWTVLLAAILVCALVNLLIVGASPRSLGRRNPVGVLCVVGPAMLALASVTGPLLRWGSAEADGEAQREEQEESLREMVERVSESEVIEDDEREMLHSVFELSSTMAREVMVPRTDMVTIGAEVPLAKAMNLFVRSGYSRVPVAGDDLDDLRGVLYLKDAVRYLNGRPGRAQHRTDRLMRTPVFIPETKPLDVLLEEMRASGVHIAIAVDEYGGVAGLVTIEDIIEELVGDLTDEHDPAEPEVVDEGEGTYLVPARLPLDELGDLFGLDIVDDDVDSTGGLLAKAMGKVPIVGATAVSHGLRMEAVDVSGRRRRLATVRVSREPQHEEES